MAVEYGTIGIRPMGAYNPGTKYDLLNLVEYDGSSYVAHTDPLLGSLPTNTAYWQVSAQGTGKATANSVGTVKPDGKTTEVSIDGKLSVKKATDTTLGLVKGTRSITVSEDGSIYIPTEFERATELVDISSGEILYMMLGKISKAISVTMGLDQNALLKNMLTNMDADDSNKIPTSAYVHKLTERIGMGTELAAGANLTAALNTVNSNLSDLSAVTARTNVATAFKARVAVETSDMGVSMPGINVVAHTDQNQYARPAISFDCYGTASGVLYMETDGSLRYASGANIYTINLTKIN